MRQLRDRDSTTLLAWNIAGVKNKTREFWEYVQKYDVVILLETWLEGKDWGVWSGRLPAGFIWERVDAKRAHVKGRAAGGIIFGIKTKGSQRKGAFKMSADLIKWKGKIGELDWSIVAVCNPCVWEKLREELKEEGEDKSVNRLVVGDMNARIGTERVVNRNDGSEIERKTKDQITNTEGAKMLKWMEEEGMIVLNGWKEGDEEGEWTYIAEQGGRIIDYGIVNGNAEVEVIRFSVEERTESDHMPITMVMGGEGDQIDQGEGKKTRAVGIYINGWKKE